MTSRTLQDYLDLAEDQGWRVHQTKNAYQVFPPKGQHIVTLRAFHGPHDEENARAMLRRAGLRLDEDRGQAKRTEKPVSSKPVQPTPSATAEPPVTDPIALIEKKFETIWTLLSEIDAHFKQLRASQENFSKLRELLKNL